MTHYTCDRCGQIMLNNDRIAGTGLRGQDFLVKELCSSCVTDFNERFMRNDKFAAPSRTRVKGDEHERDTTQSGSATEG